MAEFGLIIALAAQAAAVGRTDAGAARTITPPHLANACIDALGAVGSQPAGIQTVDGSRMKKPADLVRARKASKSVAPIIVQGGNFRGADFRKIAVTNICFVGTDLANTRWARANANGAAFVDADLSGADLSDATMARVLFRNAKLEGARANRAELSGGQFDGGWRGSLANLNLDSAQLTGFSFVCGLGEDNGCPFDRKGMTARGADLTAARLSSMAFWELDLRGAKIDRTEINFDTLRLLSGASLAGPLIVRGGDASVTLEAAEVPAVLAALPGPANEGAAACTEDTATLANILCNARGTPLEALARDVATLEGMDAALAANSARAYLNRLNSCFGKEMVQARICVTDNMKDRRERLAQALANRTWLKPGERALFVRVDDALATAVASRPALQRLSPAIAGMATSYVVVQLNSRGFASMRGAALTQSGDRCYLSANDMRRMTTTGWFNAGYAQPGTIGRRTTNVPVPLARIWNARAEIAPSSFADEGEGDSRLGSFTSCNSTAGFGGMMVKLPISDQAFATLWTSLEQKMPLAAPVAAAAK